MLNNKVVYLKAFEYCNDAIEFTNGMTKDKFLTDKKTKAAASIMIIQVAEMCNKIPDTVKTKYPDVPWHEIRGMRNRITHGYGEINFDRVWDIIDKHIPQLKSFFETRLANYEKENPVLPKKPPKMTM